MGNALPEQPFGLRVNMRRIEVSADFGLINSLQNAAMIAYSHFYCMYIESSVIIPSIVNFPIQAGSSTVSPKIRLQLPPS